MKEERGSFTIEATLVFPALLLFTLVCVFFCIIIFQLGTANYIAQKAAAQTAFTWNNSQKDQITGEFDKSTYPGLSNSTDGLYWRVTDDGIMGIFGLDNIFESQGGPKQTKISRAENAYPYNVKVEYRNIIIYSEVNTTVESTLFIPSFVESLLGGSTLTAKASRVVTDSPELIRNFNFAKYVWKETGLGGALTKLISSVGKFFGNE